MFQVLVSLLLLSIVTLSSSRRGKASLIDVDSFLTVDRALQHRKNAFQYALVIDLLSVIKELACSHRILPSYTTSKRLANLYGTVGLTSESQEWHMRASQLDTSRHQHLLTNGISAHYAGDYLQAIRHYDAALATDSSDEDTLFHKGVSLQHMGNVQGAADLFEDALRADPLYIKALLNLAVIHQKYGSHHQALAFYKRGVAITEASEQYWRSVTGGSSVAFLSEERIMLRLNLAVCLLQLKRLGEAYQEIQSLSAVLVESLRGICNADDTQECTTTAPSPAAQSLKGYLASARAIQGLVQRASLFWDSWECLQHRLLTDTLARIAFTQQQQPAQRQKSDFRGPLLPFDTLMLPVTLEDRLVVAQAASSAYPTNSGLSVKRSLVDTQSSLRLGFIGCDFGDHPTAHLVEAIFDVVRGTALSSAAHAATQLVVFNYGASDDQSTYRRQLKRLSDEFHELAHLSFSDAAALVAASAVDVLLDLQMHTLGNRLEISALRPADLMVNYLVYPGTSGAHFYDYVVVDRVVVPPAEQARHYSEALLVLPATYQISFYDRHVAAAASGAGRGDDEWSYVAVLRRQNNLPVSRKDTIFCNFNKVDKVDPESFALWMAVLRRVPRSHLWLLEPTSAATPLDESGHSEGDSRGNVVKANICASARRHGVACERVLYAQWADKAVHIARHAAADLFLDTLIYGAHSTATDALRGGLPVLTVLGDSFPSRVAASLYSSLLRDSADNEADSMPQSNVLYPVLTASSLREFEDTAVQLSRDSVESVLPGLKRALGNAVATRSGLFNTTRGVVTFIRGMQTIKEVQLHNKPHVIIPLESVI